MEIFFLCAGIHNAWDFMSFSSRAAAVKKNVEMYMCLLIGLGGLFCMGDSSKRGSGLS